MVLGAREHVSPHTGRKHREIPAARELVPPPSGELGLCQAVDRKEAGIRAPWHPEKGPPESVAMFLVALLNAHCAHFQEDGEDVITERVPEAYLKTRAADSNDSDRMAGMDAGVLA